MTKKIPAGLREYFSRMGRKGGSKGGKARVANMTEDELSKANRKAAKARWDKEKASD